HFARRQLEQRDRAFARDELRLRARRARHLGALAGPQLDVVDYRTGRNVLERQGIARQDVGFRTRRNGGAHFEAFRRDDVALLAIGIFEQRDAGRAVGIVFDRSNLRRYAEFVALEIDHAVALLVAAADEARGDAAGRVAAARFMPRLEQWFFRLVARDVYALHHGHIAQARSCGAEFFNGHVFSARLHFRELGPLLSRFEYDVSLLPVR